MKPLRITLLMLEPPLPFGNAAARWYYVLFKELVARGHQVRAFAACAKPEEIPKAQAIFPAPKYDLKCYGFPRRSGLGAKIETLRRPYSFAFSPELRRDFEASVAAGCDIIHMEQLWCGWLVGDHQAKTLVNVHHLQTIDLEETSPNGFREKLEKWQIGFAESKILRSLAHVRSCSPRLVPNMKTVNPRLNVTVVPVGIDPGQYDYIPDDRRTAEPLISVIGNMEWYPTNSAAKRLMTRLWPAIKKHVPNAKVQLVGWGAKKALPEYIDAQDVTIAENVPEIRPYFERTGVMLYAPGRGSGMKIKILESLGFGVPVVTTSEGTEGLPAIDGDHVGLCEDDAGLIERTVQLLGDPARQNRQRAAGRKLLEDHCGPQPTVDAIESIYDTMLKGTS